MMRILIAPNAFKNSLEAGLVAQAIKEGLELSKLDCNCQCFPIGDGGDGTGALIIKKFKGKQIAVRVHDPLGREINSSLGIIKQHTAVIELADASGIKLLKFSERNPMIASSYGTGELILEALNYGVQEIIIAIGGSATVDCGIGILKALGIRFLNKDGTEMSAGVDISSDLAELDLRNLDRRILSCKLILLCDVSNPLLGENGSARVFGPQKGADSEMVIKLEKFLAKFREVILQHTRIDIGNIPYGGAAGGVAAGMYALLNAELINGASYFLKLLEFNKNLDKCDLVITGEGGIDDQTLMGKGPYAVAKMAKRRGIPVIGIAGKVPDDASQALRRYFKILKSINYQPVDLELAIKNTKDNLVKSSFEIGNLLSSTSLR